MKIAVIGSGVSGIGAAWALSAHNDVSLIEASDTIGGHSRTLDIEIGGEGLSVDTGFIVYNERNYPNLTRLLSALEVDTAPSDMSFAVSLQGQSFEYAGRASALFSSLRSVGDADLWRMLAGIVRFRREANLLASGDGIPDDVDIHTYLVSRGYPGAFIDRYLMPLASAVWSGTRNEARAMPARTFIQFLDNHGLVTVTGRPPWRTVRGGARSYVDRAVKEITRVHASRPVTSVTRTRQGVVVADASGAEETFEAVVLATHADTALRILGADASAEERWVLGAFRYDENEVVLHTDAGLMPKRRRVWSSWNAIERRDDDGSRPVSVSYWMNRLQPLGVDRDLFVSLNPGDAVDPDTVIDRWITAHPQFDLRTDAAQARMPSIQGRGGVWFAGAHLGYGFHEDGLQSGFTVAAALGSPVPWHDDVTPRSPAAWVAAPDGPSHARGRSVAVT